MKVGSEVKNKQSVILGTALGIVFILVGIEALQLLVATLGGAEYAALKFNNFYFMADISYMEGSSRVMSAFTFIFPLLLALFLIEISTRVISMSKPGSVRYTSIIFQLFIVGYSLSKIFYSAFLMVLAPEYNTDWNNFLNYGEIFGVVRYLTTLIVLIMVVGYLGNTTARIKKYIDVR